VIKFLRGKVKEELVRINMSTDVYYWILAKRLHGNGDDINAGQSKCSIMQ